MDLENSHEENKSLIGGTIPEISRVDNPPKTERKGKYQIIEDKRDSNGNGYVEYFMEAPAAGKDLGLHQFKVGYQVSDRSEGTGGKRWEKVHEEDLGLAPKTDTIQ
jgi:hypothetical protein